MVSSVFAQDKSNSIKMTSLLSATFSLLSRLDRIRLRLVWFALWLRVLLLFCCSPPLTPVFVPHFSFQTSVRSLSPINPSKFGARRRDRDIFYSKLFKTERETKNLGAIKKQVLFYVTIIREATRVRPTNAGLWFLAPASRFCLALLLRLLLSSLFTG